MRTKLLLAKLLARWAHRKQERKYSGEPYYNHLVEVANILSMVPNTWQMQCAAYLHDTVEDTWVKPWMIRLLFGEYITTLVENLTDVSSASDGNRAARKEKDRLHLAVALPEAKTVKLADLISNSRTIIRDDPNFAKTFIAEKELLLADLTEGDAYLHRVATDIVRQYRRKKT